MPSSTASIPSGLDFIYVEPLEQPISAFREPPTRRYRSIPQEEWRPLVLRWLELSKSRGRDLAARDLRVSPTQLRVLAKRCEIEIPPQRTGQKSGIPRFKIAHNASLRPKEKTATHP